MKKKFFLKMNNPVLRPILIATPHKRHDALVFFVQSLLPDRNVIRINSPQDLTLENCEKLNPDYIFFPHWSWIILEEIHLKFSCVIFHMTDLPFGRGGTPLQNLIVRGKKSTTLTALKCVSELDAGPVYLRRPLSLFGTAEEILLRASDLIAQMIVEFMQTQPMPVEQQGDVVEFKRRQPKDGNISDLESLKQIYDYIRMLDAEGYPHAFLDTVHTRIEFMNAQLNDEFIEAKVLIRRKNP
jgi:methionyl-tRNA formyltransferase